MRHLSLAAVLLLLTGALHAQTLGPVDWIFLVDTSKSMRGIGGTKDIWTDVKVSLDAFVREAGEHDSITLYAFDADVREIQASRADLYRAILTLPAEGKRTHLGAAIADGLARAESLRRGRSKDATRRQVVVLFTDGREDVKGIEHPVPIAASLDRVGSTYVFFVSMGDHEPQLDEFDAASDRATVLRAPTGEAIRNLAHKIRAKIPLPEPPPQKPIEVQPPPPPQPVDQPSPVKNALIAATLLISLAAIALLALQQRRKQNRLEGELEILRPHAAPDAAFVGLPTLRANEIALSAILPADALAGSDARLFVKRKAGRKKVWIAAQGGSLRINDVETPMGELYDADTIDIGDARLRFNRIGDEREFESHQEGAL